jgi:hypothetical protein
MCGAFSKSWLIKSLYKRKKVKKYTFTTFLSLTTKLNDAFIASRSWSPMPDRENTNIALIISEGN